MNFLELFRQFLEEVRRYSTPYAFVKYAREVVGKQINILISIEEGETGVKHKEYRLVEDVIKEIPCRVEHVTIPVVAFYDFDNEITVEIRTARKVVAKVAKAANWVPLWDYAPIIFYPSTTLVIEPKPRSVVVLRLEPRG